MLTIDKLKTIAAQTYDPSLSIYLPTTSTGSNLEDQLHLKHALSEAHQKLVAYGFTQEAAHQFLQPGYELLDDAQLWVHLSDGLVLFIAEDYFDYFVIPLKVKDLICLGSKFYFDPLMPLIDEY